MTWDEAWREGRTGWDAGASPPALDEWLERHKVEPGRALVPGCGAGYDVFTLAEAGWEAVGLEVSPTAAGRFDEERRKRGIPLESAHIQVADFFGSDLGPFDLIFDYTFLCAIEPQRRHDWASAMRKLLDDEGRLVTLVFPISEEREWEEGPPYRLSIDLVRGIASPQFVLVDSYRPARSHLGREGMEVLLEWAPRHES